MRIQRKRLLLNLLRLAVTVAAVSWLLANVNWQDSGAPETSEFEPGLLTVFRDIQPTYLLLALVTYPLAIILGAIRWRQLIAAKDMDPGFGSAVRLTWMGYFWNLVFPGLTGGDLVKAYHVARSAENRAVSVMTVFLDRVIGLTGLAILSGAVLLLNLGNPELRAVSGGILAFLVSLFLGGVIFFSRRLRLWFGLDKLLALLPFQESVSSLDQALFEYRYQKNTLFIALSLSLIIHVINVGAFLFAGLALGLTVSWVHYFVFIPVTLMIAAIPFSIGGLGVLEGGVTHFLTLDQVGTSGAEALAVCVIYRAVTLVTGLPGAFVKSKVAEQSDPETVSEAAVGGSLRGGGSSPTDLEQVPGH